MKKSFLTFELLEQMDGERVTKSWRVTGSNGTPLGHIQWHAPWRRYCFFVGTLGGPYVFDAACLAELSAFLSTATVNRQLERKLVKQWNY
jgi:hypothetical protein